MKGILLYKGKYGATEQYAAWVGKELNLPVKMAHECSETDLAKADFVILGTSVYIGIPVIKDWVKDNLEILITKKIFLFVVCGTPLHEKVKLQSYVASSIPGQILENCKVYFLPGRLVFRKLSWSDKFLLRIGYLLSPKKQKESMHLTDYNDVKKENLSELIKDVRKGLAVKEQIVSSTR